MSSLRRWMRAAVAVAAVALVSAAALGQADKKTERLWKAKCASCHGADGKAQTDLGKQMGVADYTTREWQKGRSDAQLKQAILDGVKWERGGKKQEMGGYKDTLTPAQVDALVAHIRAFAQ